MNEKIEDVPNVELYGIKEIKELLAFGFKFQAAITGSLEDDKFNWMDTFRFTSPLLAASDAFNGLKLIDEEIQNLSESEKVELRNFAKTFYPNFDNNELQILIEDTVLSLLDTYNLARRWANRAKRKIEVA